jgi:hypothetical protein
VYRFPIIQQPEAFAGSDQLGAATPGAGVDRSADRIELAVEA